MEDDALGRLIKRTDSDGVTNWAWDVATHDVGELAASVSAGGVTTSYVYDSLSRPAATILSIGSESFELDVGYDGVGRVDTITYPEGFSDRLRGAQRSAELRDIVLVLAEWQHRREVGCRDLFL